MKTNTVLNLKISGIGIDGDGIAEINPNFSVYVPGAAEGEILKVRITEAHKTYARAEILKILSPSKSRVKPFCKLSDLCGGCQLQHIDYNYQLIVKQRIVKQCLDFFDGEIFKTLPSENVFRYRNKALIPFSKDKSGKITAGIYAKNSHEIINCTDCPTVFEEADKILQTVVLHLEKYGIEPYDEKTLSGVLRHVLIRKGFFTDELMVSLIINAEKLPQENELLNSLVQKISNIKTVCICPNLQNTNVINGKSYRIIYGEGFITDFIGKIKYKISPLSFFQINSFQTVRLYEKVLDFAALTGQETVFDLYCGVGTISLFLAQKVKKVYGVEIVPQAIENAKENAALNGISNAEFFCGNAEDVIPDMVENKGVTADVVVVDPPRKGCDKKLLETIIKLKPKKFVYVSCNPVSLSRDCKFLTSNGFKIEKVQPVDMFPHTAHVETVCLLTFSS